MAAALDPLRRRLGDRAPSLAELVVTGARTVLLELDARERARAQSLETFVARLSAGSPADLQEADTIRRATRR
ncbi:MAG: hypothetical protein ACRC35_12090 [Angustibacter sp.]